MADLTRDASLHHILTRWRHVERELRDADGERRAQLERSVEELRGRYQIIRAHVEQRVTDEERAG